MFDFADKKMARPEQLQSNEKTAEYVSAGDRLRRFFFFVLKAQSLLYSKKYLIRMRRVCLRKMAADKSYSLARGN